MIGVALTSLLSFFCVGLLSRNNKESQRFIKVIVDLLAISAQATGFVVWPIVEQKPHLWIIPIAVFLTSLGWWENYISRHSPIPFIKMLGKIKENYDITRYFSYIFISVWKCVCFFLCTLFILLIKEGDVSFFFSNFSEGFGEHSITILEVRS